MDEKIREEVLYREALALGLDKEDTIVKRRLAQKMEFLAEDVSALREPQINELKDWFEKNSQRFALPGRIWFHHVYFSFDRKGEEASKAAARAYKELAGEPVDSAVATRVADPFMFQDYYADCSRGSGSQNFWIKVRQSALSAPVRFLARTHRIRIGLASGLGGFNDADSRARLRRSGTSRENRMAGRAKRRVQTKGICDHEGPL